jgi:flagellar hook-length control protein FliK
MSYVDDNAVLTMPATVLPQTDWLVSLLSPQAQSQINNEITNHTVAQLPTDLLMHEQLVYRDATSPLTLEKMLTSLGRTDLMDYAMRLEQSTARAFNSSNLQVSNSPQQTDNSVMSSRLTMSVDGTSQPLTRLPTTPAELIIVQNNLRATPAANLLHDSASVADGSSFKSLMTSASVQGNEPALSQWKSESLGQSPSQWGQKLLSMLSDKVQLQLGQQVQKAQIRLDPPQLGSIDISIRVEQDRATVHLVASNQQVREAMQQTIEQLRQTLGTKLGSEIHVSVQADGSDQRQSRQPHNADLEQSVASQWHEPIMESDPMPTEHSRAWLNRLV